MLSIPLTVLKYTMGRTVTNEIKVERLAALSHIRASNVKDATGTDLMTLKAGRTKI